jgi:hypothetical protein
VSVRHVRASAPQPCIQVFREADIIVTSLVDTLVWGTPWGITTAAMPSRRALVWPVDRLLGRASLQERRGGRQDSTFGETWYAVLMFLGSCRADAD